MSQLPPRPPEAFPVNDPALVAPPEHPEVADGAPPAPPPEGRITLPSAAELGQGLRWGAVLASALTALAALAASVWFARFVSVAVARDDWIGWTAFTLLAIAALAAGVLLVREAIGLARLGRLGRVRRDAEAALRDRDVAAERRAARAVAALLRGRSDAAWGLARVREHEGDVRDAGDLLVLTERELVAPLDSEARRKVLASAKRISLVTAMSPIALIAVVYVLIENLRMLRGLATLYGGRPGFWGSVRLARHVVAHLIATGGLALTDDLLGQFLGQDVLRRLSRRLGEGAFNGAMTARVGTAAIDVLRPLPFIEATPVRARDILTELFRRPVPSTKPTTGA